MKIAKQEETETYKDAELLPLRALICAKIETAFYDWKHLSKGKAPVTSGFKSDFRIAEERELIIEYFVSDREGSLIDDLRFLYDNWEDTYVNIMDKIWAELP